MTTRLMQRSRLPTTHARTSRINSKTLRVLTLITQNAIMRVHESRKRGLWLRHAVVLISGILLVHGQPLTSAAVGFHEDGVAEDEATVARAVGLLGADVAGGLVIDAVVIGDVELGAIRDGTAMSKECMISRKFR